MLPARALNAPPSPTIHPHPQVLIVHEPGTELPPPPTREQERHQLPAALAATEADDGVTPPMRRARTRQFRPRFTITRDSVFKYEECLLEIMHGR
jgi:hypothetical protein